MPECGVRPGAVRVTEIAQVVMDGGWEAAWMWAEVSARRRTVDLWEGSGGSCEEGM